ncbi:MAG: hypothetical protein WCE57_11220, partial [Salegentibacter sp.]
ALDGKHTFGNIDETRVSFVEKKIEENRMVFLKNLLEHNGFEVIVQEEKRKTEEDPQLYTLGVTDMTFNPVVAVYERKLKTFDGHKVTPEYWNQESESTAPQYWQKK